MRIYIFVVILYVLAAVVYGMSLKAIQLTDEGQKNVKTDIALMVVVALGLAYAGHTYVQSATSNHFILLILLSVAYIACIGYHSYLMVQYAQKKED